MNQLTVRGIDQSLKRRIREIANERGVSLNKAAIMRMRQGATLDALRQRTRCVGDCLNTSIGSWSAQEEVEFLEAIRPLDKIDPEFWK